MDSRSTETWTVPELKRYLKARDIPVSNHKKQDLVEMVRKCMLQPDLVSVREEDDNENVQSLRRSVDVNGKVLVFPDPYSVNTWEENLQGLPAVSIENCLCYLIFKMNWPSKRVNSLKGERGYSLYQENHIQSVMMTPEIHGLVYIKAKCVRQTAQREAPYEVWILVTQEGTIEAAGCQCIG